MILREPVLISIVTAMPGLSFDALFVDLHVRTVDRKRGFTALEIVRTG
jgi:hypothetical protein